MFFNKNIQMACYIVFGRFHNDFQNNFISALLLRAPSPITTRLKLKKVLWAPGRRNTVNKI